MLSVLLAVEQEEQLRELPVEPLWIGVGTLVLLFGAMLGLLMFGKGRPHT